MSSIFFSVLIFLVKLTVIALGLDKYSRDDFPPPPTFVFGASTSAYQVEGAVNEDGRTPSIWDTFSHGYAKKNGNGDVASDQYHKFKEDVQLMVKTGLEAYRFSISWSRLIPNGKGPVNPKGVQYYNNLINELVRHGIEPHVTIHHSDFPQALEDEYGGWINRQIVKDFTAYADVCFREFGDRVLHWTTMNEPNIFILGGYDFGNNPPQHCSFPFGVVNCSTGNSSTEPYIATHNTLLAHALAAKLYKEKYQKKQKGFLGINLYVMYILPLTNATEDVNAAQRANDFFVGWYMNPLIYGDYPDIMKKNAGSRLPIFSSQESELVKGSFDFVGLNHYYRIYVKHKPKRLDLGLRDYAADMEIDMMYGESGEAWAFDLFTPSALQGVLEYFKQAYDNPPIYIHENGLVTLRSASLTDTSRVEFMQAYIGSMLDAVRNGSNARGYFSWSFIDLYELMDGYKSSYGLYYVDMDDPDRKRYPKLSAEWYSDFLKGTSNSSKGSFGAINEYISAKHQAHFSH